MKTREEKIMIKLDFFFLTCVKKNQHIHNLVHGNSSWFTFGLHLVRSPKALWFDIVRNRTMEVGPWKRPSSMVRFHGPWCKPALLSYKKIHITEHTCTIPQSRGKCFIVFIVHAAVCMFDNVFASFFTYDTQKLAHTQKCASIDTQNLEFDTYCDLWRKDSKRKEKKKKHVNRHVTNWNDMDRQLKYYKL